MPVDPHWRAPLDGARHRHMREREGPAIRRLPLPQMTGLADSSGFMVRLAGLTRTLLKIAPDSPVWVSVAPAEYRRPMGDFTYRRIVSAAKGMFAVLGVKVSHTGSEHIPAEGGAVLAINHIGYLDFVFAGIPVDARGHRLVRFMAKEETFTHRVSGPLMRSMQHIPVDRAAGTAAFRAAVAALKAGELVGVFPEATMSRSIEIKEIKSGAVRMARAAKVPLIPMVVFGTQRLITYGHRDLSRGTAVFITVGEPIPTSGDPEEVALVLRARLQELLDDTIARYPQRPSSPDDGWWMPQRLGGTAPTLEEAAVLEAELVATRAARKAAKLAEQGDQPA